MPTPDRRPPKLPEAFTEIDQEDKMTPDQINLVKTSFAKVVPIASDAAAIFYARLFETNPEFRPMFKSDLVEQGDKLMKMLATAVNGLDRLDDILPAVRALAARHVGYGVAPEHYGAVGAALLWTLGQGLGPEFTPEAEEAWAATYETLSSAMIEAAYPAAAE